MKKNLLGFSILLFFITRYFIFTHPPYDKLKGGYSDVKHYYERYANIWWYGLPPYLKHLYEYPPATIPLVIFPLFLDQKGIGKYYQNYRIQILFFDFLLFTLILKFLTKVKYKNFSKWLSVLFYIFAGLIAKDFLYEGIDLVFSGTLVFSLISYYLYSQKDLLKRIFFWMFFWLSTAIKFVSIPLVPAFFFLKSLSFKKELLAITFGFLLVWGLPLLIFGSSLSVSLVYNSARSFKYSSFPYFIAETINAFTKTETKVDQPPDFSLTGPYSAVILKVFNLLLPLTTLGVIFYSLWIIFKKRKFDPYLLIIKITLIYIFIFLLTSKIYSQPFPIWLIPLVTILPFSSLKRQLLFMLFGALLLIFDTTNILNLGLFGLKVFIQPLTYGFLRNSLKFLTIIFLFFSTLKIPIQEKPYK